MMRKGLLFCLFSFVILLGAQATPDRIVVQVPATGEAGPRAIVEKDSGDLVLADIAKDGTLKYQNSLGRLASIPDPVIQKWLPKSRPATNFITAETHGKTLYVITTTGLSADPDTKDPYTGKPLYERKDKLLILSKSSDQIRPLLTRSFDAIDNVSVEDVPEETAKFVVVSTSEGQVSNSLLHIFRLTSGVKVESIKLPEPSEDGHWQESFTISNGKGILTIALSEPGSFPGHPNSTKESVSTFRWDSTAKSFVPISQNISYK